MTPAEPARGETRELIVHSTICPHMLGPLGGSALEGSTIECPWHGYRFDVRSGESVDGRGMRLRRAPRVEIEEKVAELAGRLEEKLQK